MVASGFFDRARWSDLERDGQVHTYGEARIYDARAGVRAGPPGTREVVGVWRDRLVVMGDDRASVERALESIGAALAVARVEAQATDAGQFSIDLALPADRLERWFDGCARREEGRRPEGPGSDEAR